MCVMSMVMDDFSKRLPDPVIIPQQWWPTWQNTPPPEPPWLAELRQLLKDFHEAVAAAKTVDRLTNQPDCVDPEKIKLEERVAELERRIEALEKWRSG